LLELYFKKIFDISPNMVSGPYRISGIKPLPDIRYPAFGLAGYPVGRISGKTVSGASLQN
jgi:hypothetical protein